MSSLKANLRAQAALFPGLTALLGTAPLRWYDERLNQGSALPAVVVTVVSDPPTYVATGRLRTGWSRVQFLIWGATPGSDSAFAVETQLLLFFDQLNLIGIPGLTQYPNYVVLRRDSMYPQTDPPIYQRIVDAMMFSNSSKL